MSDTAILTMTDDYTAYSDTLQMPSTIKPTTADRFFKDATLIAPFGIAALMALYFVARLFLHT